MFFISKITSHSVVDYAAEELKKYLRMMMPEGGDATISYNPEATDGFRLGLMQARLINTDVKRYEANEKMKLKNILTTTYISESITGHKTTKNIWSTVFFHYKTNKN